VLSVQADAFTFPCNRPLPAAGALDQGVAEAVEGALGADFLHRLREALC
jgi:hypothetical protein